MENSIGSGGAQKKESGKIITARQSQYLEAYRATNSAAKAAKLMGVTTDSVRESLRRVARQFGKNAISDLLERNANDNRSVATAKELMKLLKSQDYRCALTGEKLTPNTAELDHKIPKSKGGSDSIDNLQWIDREVNRMKGRLSDDEFIAICKRVVGWTG